MNAVRLCDGAALILFALMFLRTAKTWLSPSKSGGRPVRARTADLYRVNLEVQNLKPLGCLAFPSLTNPKSPQEPSFGGELVTSFEQGAKLRERI